MSEELISKIKKTFLESILIKQAILDQELCQVLVTVGHAMLQYIEDKLLNEDYLQKS